MILINDMNAQVGLWGAEQDRRPSDGGVAPQRMIAVLVSLIVGRVASVATISFSGMWSAAGAVTLSAALAASGLR